MIEITKITDVKKYLDDIEAVIFDLDDTLFPEKEYVKSGYKQIAEYFGDPLLADKLWQVFERGGRSIDEVIPPDKKAEALKVYRNQIPDIHFFAGASDMLCELEKIKKIGIITDGRPEGQRAKIKVLGLDRFEIIITDELGGPEFRKPCEAAFRLMQEKIQVPFEKMVYIGDNPNKDFIAPEKLGMKYIYFNNSDGLYSR
ncbi:MAG: HAD family hydrolase [Clostridiales bacterium]|nr:HAD family hydrolase [Candidatus Equinaster intestinalis]